MEPIRMITDKSELQGTAYVELKPGIVDGKCWGDDSVYFDEESFGFVEACFEEVLSDFDHYAFTEVPTSILPTLIERLHRLRAFLGKVSSAAELNGRVYFFFKDTEENFQQSFNRHRQALEDMIDQLVAWLAKQADEQDAIAVLGL